MLTETADHNAPPTDNGVLSPLTSHHRHPPGERRHQYGRWHVGRRHFGTVAGPDDLNDRAEITSEVSRLFNVFARQLYGQTQNPYLAFEAGKQRLDIETRIDADGSRGIHNMVIFCFDLTAAVIAHRHGRGPDFLVHDSHLYDGVDERQVSAALQLAADAMADGDMQYIVTMNTDDLRKAEAKGFDPGPHVIEPRLTDQPDGGLFGFRF